METIFSYLIFLFPQVETVTEISGDPFFGKNFILARSKGFSVQWKLFSYILRSGTRHKSPFSQVNVYYGGQLKTAVEQEAGKKIDCKR